MSYLTPQACYLVRGEIPFSPKQMAEIYANQGGKIQVGIRYEDGTIHFIGSRDAEREGSEEYKRITQTMLDSVEFKNFAERAVNAHKSVTMTLYSAYGLIPISASNMEAARKGQIPFFDLNISVVAGKFIVTTSADSVSQKEAEFLNIATNTFPPFEKKKSLPLPDRKYSPTGLPSTLSTVSDPIVLTKSPPTGKIPIPTSTDHFPLRSQAARQPRSKGIRRIHDAPDSGMYAPLYADMKAPIVTISSGDEADGTTVNATNPNATDPTLQAFQRLAAVGTSATRILAEGEPSTSKAPPTVAAPDATQDSSSQESEYIEEELPE